MNDNAMHKVRLDKWLWAARFFKTRSLAKKAIEGGKVHCDGARSKVSRDVTLGMTLEIRQGWDEKTVVVKALSDQRRGAPEAAKLYEETEESIAKRALEAEKRKAWRHANIAPETKPNKKQRRALDHIKKFRQDDPES